MEEESKSKWLDFTLALLLLTPGLLVFQQSATSLQDQGAASGDAMTNSAMFPKIVATVLLALAALQAFLAWRRKSDAANGEALSKRGRSLLVMAFLAIYIWSITLLGYHIVTPLLCASVLLILGLQPWKAAAVGLGMSLVVALFFESLLNVILPVGYFDLALPF